MYKLGITGPYCQASTSQEKETLQQVFDEYSGLSGFSLSAITHTKRTPWYAVWHENKYNLKIPNHLIKNYYKELANSA